MTTPALRFDDVSVSYGADEVLSGITGEVLQWFSEDNPEQWGDDVPLAVRGGSSG